MFQNTLNYIKIVEPLMIIVVGRIMTPPQRCLHNGTCDYVTLYYKKGFTDVIKLRILK